MDDGLVRCLNLPKPHPATIGRRSPDAAAMDEALSDPSIVLATRAPRRPKDGAPQTQSALVSQVMTPRSPTSRPNITEGCPLRPAREP